ncbi:MAG: DUF1893 domain-containing protein [Candidatus Acetothermia bacterium]
MTELSKRYDRLIPFVEEDGFTLVVLEGERVIFSSEESGLTPLLTFLGSVNLDYTDFTAVDKVVGGAAARLMVFAGVGEVYTPLISEVAVELLKCRDVPFYSETQVEAIVNPSSTDGCPLEKLAREVEDDSEFYYLVKRRTS